MERKLFSETKTVNVIVNASVAFTSAMIMKTILPPAPNYLIDAASKIGMLATSHQIAKVTTKGFVADMADTERMFVSMLVDLTNDAKEFREDVKKEKATE